MGFGWTALALGYAAMAPATIDTGARVVDVAPSVESLDLGEVVWMLEDPSGDLGLDDVRGEGGAGFQPWRDESLNFGYSKSTYWFRFRLDLPAGTAGRWLIEIANPQIDHVTVYLYAPGGEPTARATGDDRPFHHRDIAAPTMIVRIPEELGTRVEGFVRVASTGTINVPLRLWREEALMESLARRQLGWGLYFAFLLGLALYNLFVYFVVRDRSYLYYVGYMVGLVLCQASLSGHAFQYLWPHAPGFATVAVVTFACPTLTMAYLFIRRMANLREVVPRLDRPMLYAAIAFLVPLPLVWFAYPIGARVVTVLVAVGLLFLPVPILTSYVRGYRPARYLALGVGLVAPGALAIALRQLGVLPEHFLTTYTIQFGTAIEALVLSFALADRIALLTRAEAEARERRFSAEVKALDAQRELSSRLIAAQDAERRRIAGELHDGLGQNMIVIVNKLSRLARERGEGTGPLIDLARQSVSELRDVAHDLHPHKLDRLGLAAALESTVDHAADAAGIDGECHVGDVDGLLPPEGELHVYRIVQEAVANAVKHAAATEIAVRVRRAGDLLEIRVEDDGAGFAADAGVGLGLAGIEERARLLGGEVRFESAPGEGVRVEVDVPVGEAS